VTLSDVQRLERDYVMPTYSPRYPVEFVRGRGTRLWDSDGNEYLDFLAGISVVQIGHCHPALVEALSRQAATLVHTADLFFTEGPMLLAQRLSERSIGGKVFFTNSGAEATECALKLARKRRRGGGFVVLDGAFHGRTMGALSATPQEAKQAPFAPLVPGFRTVPRDDPDALSAAVGDETAAVLIEPIQGESGIHPLRQEVLEAAREACDRHGALLVFDEVQCGMGRTGTMWAYEANGVRPDIVTMAKGLGGGFPIGACVAAVPDDDQLKLSEHGSTFAGSPLAAAAALAVLDVVEAPGFLDEVRAKGERLAAGLRELPVRDVRGRGLMLACDLDGAKQVAERLLFEQRLVVNATGPYTIRFLPPLTVTEAEIDAALERLAAVVGR
jgi:predicted acetylornithine/succinylornithine family transaminase